MKAPEPAEQWRPKVLDAFDHANTCIRSEIVTFDKAPQSEDCLALNIYVPGCITQITAEIISHN